MPATWEVFFVGADSSTETMELNVCLLNAINSTIEIYINEKSMYVKNLFKFSHKVLYSFVENGQTNLTILEFVTYRTSKLSRTSDTSVNYEERSHLLILELV